MKKRFTTRPILVLALASACFGISFVTQAEAWNIAYSASACSTYQASKSGGKKLQIFYRSDKVYGIKFEYEGAIGRKITGDIAVKTGGGWTSFNTPLQVVHDATIGTAVWSYRGVSSQLLAGIRAGSAIKFNQFEYSLSGSSAALNRIRKCIEDRG